MDTHPKCDSDFKTPDATHAPDVQKFIVHIMKLSRKSRAGFSNVSKMA